MYLNVFASSRKRYIAFITALHTKIEGILRAVGSRFLYLCARSKFRSTCHGLTYYGNTCYNLTTTLNLTWLCISGEPLCYYSSEWFSIAKNSIFIGINFILVEIKSIVQLKVFIGWVCPIMANLYWSLLLTDINIEWTR